MLFQVWCVIVPRGTYGFRCESGPRLYSSAATVLPRTRKDRMKTRFNDLPPYVIDILIQIFHCPRSSGVGQLAIEAIDYTTIFRSGRGRRGTASTWEYSKAMAAILSPAATMNQHAVARSDVSGAIQHLVRSDVVQNDAVSFCGVQPRRHGTSLRCGGPTNSAYAPLIGIAAPT